RVEVGMVRVPRQGAAVGAAGIEVADALEVGQEPDAAAQPERTGDVALQPGEARELALARNVEPQGAGGAAAVALPARWVGGVAPDDFYPIALVGEVIHLTVRQELRQAAAGVELEGAVVAEEGLAVGADEDDAALRRPAAHHQVRAEPRH